MIQTCAGLVHRSQTHMLACPVLLATCQIALLVIIIFWVIRSSKLDLQSKLTKITVTESVAFQNLPATSYQKNNNITSPNFSLKFRLHLSVWNQQGKGLEDLV